MFRKIALIRLFIYCRKFLRHAAKPTVAVMALFSTSLAFTVPVVDGNTIEWPDDGWYQVEDRLTGIVVCQGGSECTIPDGIYWVTLYRPDGSGAGWRVEIGTPEEVLYSTESFAETIYVNGLSINWNLDGWYQVQSADDFVEVCNGQSTCTVATAGQYLVINHSLGLRTLVDVGELQDDIPQDISSPIHSGSIVVEGSTISWSDSGWYQIQNSTDFTTVCEGENFCELPHGSYIVINHSTGERWEDIVVPAEQSGEQIDTAYLVTANVSVSGNTISWVDDGWYQVQDKSNFETICEGGRTCMVPDGTYIVINHTTGLRSEVTVDNSATIQVTMQHR